MATGSRMIPDQPRSPGPPPHHLSLHCAKFTPHVFLGLFLRLNLSLQLSVLHLTQDFSENRPRLIAHLQQIVPAKQTWRSNLLRRRLSHGAADKPITIKPPVAAVIVHPQQLKGPLASLHATKGCAHLIPDTVLGLQ